MIAATRRSQRRALLVRKNDLTLKELRAAAEWKCSLQAINVVLGKMGLTYKKRHSMPASKTALTWRGRVGAGGKGRPAGIRPS
jgi:transposase